MSVQHLHLPFEIVNPNGGAIAMGHPLGCTGARQIATAFAEAKREKKKVFVTSMCIGSGMVSTASQDEAEGADNAGHGRGLRERAVICPMYRGRFCAFRCTCMACPGPSRVHMFLARRIFSSWPRASDCSGPAMPHFSSFGSLAVGASDKLLVLSSRVDPRVSGLWNCGAIRGQMTAYLGVLLVSGLPYKAGCPRLGRGHPLSC